MPNTSGKGEFNHDWLQIAMAAQGCVSGTLEEWPALRVALRKSGREYSVETTALELQEICHELIEPTLADAPPEG